MGGTATPSSEYPCLTSALRLPEPVPLHDCSHILISSRQSWGRHLFIPRLTRDHTSTLSSFNFRSNQILNVKTSVIHYNTVMCTNSTDHTVFRAFGNVIPGDKETDIKDLSVIWIRVALISVLIKLTYSESCSSKSVIHCPTHFKCSSGWLSARVLWK
jgi:hypothetical protein